MISNNEMRAKARRILGKELFSASWLYPVLVVLIITAITSALSYTGIGTILITGILAIASVTYFVGRVRGKVEISDLNSCIEGVKRCGTNAFIAGLIYTLFVTLGTLLFIVPGIILSCSYSMVFFILHDNPDMKAMDALKESARLMKGHKWQYFCLSLSFIGWMLLGSLCLGVGTLWASAYMETAYAVFYEELIATERGYFNKTAEENTSGPSDAE